MKIPTVEELIVAELDEEEAFKKRPIVPILHHGRRALDLANDPDATDDSLKAAVQEEVTIKTYYTMSSLSGAVKAGNLEAVRRLIAAGAQIHTKDRTYSETSAVIHAAHEQHPDILAYLLNVEKLQIERSAYTPEALLNAQNPAEKQRLLEAREFLANGDELKLRAVAQAIENGDSVILNLLSDHSAPSEYTTSWYGTRSLELAAKHGRLEVVQELLSRNINPNGDSKDFQSSLSIAAANGSLPIVRALLQAGAKLDQDRPMSEAAKGGHIHIIQYLMDFGIDTDTYNDALVYAAFRGHLDVVEKFLQEGASADHEAEGGTALQLAAKRNHIEVVKRLLRAGADVNAGSDSPVDEQTALEAAVANGNLSMVEMLLEAGAIVKQVYNSSGTTSAFAVAIRDGHTSIIARLVQGGHWPMDAPDNTGTHHLAGVLHYAAIKGYEGSVRQLLDIGASLGQVRFPFPRNTVAQAADLGYHHIVDMLLESGANLKSDRYWEATPLQRAVLGGHTETVRVLLAQGAGIDDRSQDTKPPLHIACINGDPAMVSLLLEHGADINSLSYKDKTALYYAESSNNFEVLALIRSAEVKFYKSIGGRDSRNPRNNSGASAVVTAGTCLSCSLLSQVLLSDCYTFEPDSEVQTLSGQNTFRITLRTLWVAANRGCRFCEFLWTHLELSEAFSTPYNAAVWLECLGASLRWSVSRDFSRDLPEPWSWSKAQKNLGDCFIRVKGQNSHALSTALPSTIDAVAESLEHCKTSHQACWAEGDSFFRPTRVIDVSEWNQHRRIKLLPADTSKKTSKAYIALSHRWDYAVTQTATTLLNMDLRRARIDPDGLPATFLHCFSIAAHLKIDYVWIDSLCIIQDDSRDWSVESALMSEIYCNSYLTLAANSNEAGFGGLFHSKIDRVASNFAVRVKQGRPKLYHLKEDFDWEASLERGPLQSRAWCLQERELAPKVMHWTDQQMLWECRKQKAYQDLNGSMVWMNTANDRRAWDLIASANLDEIFDLWLRTIERYTQRTLTFSTDTLPAIGGLARLVNQRTSSEYRAGMWADDLRRSLTWYSYEFRGTQTTQRHRNEYIAPTWSWASVRGRISYYETKSKSPLNEWKFCEPIYKDEGIAAIDDHSVWCSTTNIYGEVNGGALHITASVVWAFFRNDREHSIISLEDQQEMGYMRWDDGSEQHRHGHVACILMINHYRKDYRPDEGGIGLALVLVDGQDHTYKRVGCTFGLRSSRFAGVPVEQIIIV